MECALCPHDADDGVEVTLDGCRATARPSRKGKWVGVRGRPGVLRGAYQFTVWLPEPCLVRVGWSAPTSSRIVGLDGASFGYGGTAMAVTGRKFEQYGAEYHQEAGASVVCLLDRRDPEAETISFCLNGRNLGVAFRLPPDLAGVPLFPAVCGKDAWCADFGPQSLEYPRDVYQLLASAIVACDAAVDSHLLGLSPGDADACVSVSHDGCQACCEGEQGRNAWSGARGRPGVLCGRYQFEIELESECLLRVGWSSLRSSRVIGNDARSFGYGGTAKKSTGGQYEDYGEKFQGKVGMVVSCLIDRCDPEQQTISYSIDGRNLGRAFHLPQELSCTPLFPAVCGKGGWRATCRFTDLRFPEEDHRRLAEALTMRDAVLIDGSMNGAMAPKGSRVITDTECTADLAQSKRSRDPRSHLEVLAQASTSPVEGVQPGKRVVLHVHAGPWQGWYTCEVVSTDPMGCYLKHDSDGYTENVPWGFLNGGKYTMELLPDDDKASSLETESPAPKRSDGQAEQGGTLTRTCEEPPGICCDGKEGGGAAASVLRVGSLRVHSDLGAGLTLVACEFGYFVSRIDEPGQADVRRGDAIVVIGETMLLGLEEDEVEASFGAAFGEGCNVVVGNYLSLRRLPFSEVRLCAEQLLLELQQPEPSVIDLEQQVAPLPPSRGALVGLARSISDGLAFGSCCLRKCRLHLDLLSGEAGLELSTCKAGYAVEQVLPRPGQPGLSTGDAIVAIGGMLLMGMDAEEVERCFGEAMRDGVELVTGSLADLTCWPFEMVQHEARQLLAAPLPLPSAAALQRMRTE